MIMNIIVPHGEQESPTIGIRATTSGFSHQQRQHSMHGWRKLLNLHEHLAIAKSMEKTMEQKAES
jgi:hypothetical protein